jgi:hypothetical protein
MAELLSVNELSNLTGKDRRTITTRLSGVLHEDGPKGAHLYDSAIALALLYGADSDGKSLEQARKELALEQAALTRTRNESERKERIPHAVIDQVDNETFQAISASLKNAKGKVLTQELINTIFAGFRAMPEAREKEARQKGVRGRG